MKTSQNGINLIKRFEGCKLTAYKCPAGVWTIAYGHTAGVYSGMKITQQQADEFITQQQADEFLKQDLVVYENHVNNLNRSFNQNEFDALVSFCYNCGAGSLQTLCKNRTNAQIADALLLYNKGGGKVLQGLVNRRKAERELFLKPVDPNALPYDVRTTSDLNIRTGAGTNYSIIRVANKGEILTVWAIQTNGDIKWGKNGKEYFSLSYCERI